MIFKRPKGKFVASSLAQPTLPQDEVEKDVASLPMKSPIMETSPTEGSTDAYPQRRPITIDSTTDAPSLDEEPSPEFNDNITEFINHLANEEDKVKVRTFMRSSDKKENDGSPEYYNWMAPVYALAPDQVAKGQWLKKLVEKHADFIGLCKGSVDVKALDYAAGTGFLSHALAPYVNQIFAVDYAQGMVDSYNTIAAETIADHPTCKMKAIRGDLSQYRDPSYLIANPSVNFDDFDDFDLIAMCLAVDFFTSSEGCREELKTGLAEPILYLKPSGTILIIDIEKCKDPELDQGLLDGEKPTGNSSEDVIAALEDLGFEDIEVKHERFRCEIIQGIDFRRNEAYFVIKARKGKRSYSSLPQDESS